MNKKGELDRIFIMQLVILVVISSSFLWQTQAYASSDRVQKTTAVDDLALMVDTLFTLEGDVVIAYPHDLSAYTIVLSSSQVTLTTKDGAKGTELIRPYKVPEGYSVAGSLPFKQRGCLEKKGKKLLLRECKVDEK